MARTFDVVIVGAGIMGLSIAYYLKKKGCRRVLVLEKEESWITGSTAKANGGFRQQFSDPVNILLSQLSLPVLKNFREEFHTDISLAQNGYLFVTATESGEKVLKQNLNTQRRYGVPAEWLSPEQVGQLAPYLRTTDLRGGTFCGQDGYGDSYSIAAGFGREALRQGALLKTSSPVVEVLTSSGKILGVKTPSETFHASNVVNAAGPYAAVIGSYANVNVPVTPVRRMIVMTEEFLPIPDTIPMVIDTDSGFFMRKESGRVLMGWSDPDEPSSFNTSFDPNFVDVVAEKAMARVPVMERAQINARRSWAGLYEISPDHHCILGEASKLKGFFVANGFSGHGMMHAPAVGMILSDLILQGKTELIDIHPVRLSRFEEGDLIHERVVI